ncbi:hypothetical protein P5673_005297 [Acropora cervicornis]|uniref:Uncharacterized protein n=1 Tax=Acropora cervicornis TaxID=6130 RepID=A0AAD9R0F0_ACRCE|nr:hypothetical protein P5673_005297 [Acropora cervicornis]
MDVLDSLCQRTKLCQARAGPDFPYLKGGRRKFKYIHLLEQHEEDLTRWYFSNQNENPKSWPSVERVLDENDRDCLNASTEMPADCNSLLQEDNTTETIKRIEEKKWEL